MCGQYRDWYEALELDVYLLKLEYPLAFMPSFLFDHRSSRQALNKNFMIEMINRLYRTFFRGSVRKLHTFEFEVDDNIFIDMYFNSIDHSISDVLCQLMGGSIIDKSLAAELHGIVVLFCFLRSVTI